MGEFNTASRTGSNAGIVSYSEQRWKKSQHDNEDDEYNVDNGEDDDDDDDDNECKRYNTILYNVSNYLASNHSARSSEERSINAAFARILSSD